MTGASTTAGIRVRARVVAANTAVGVEIASLLRRAGIPVTTPSDGRAPQAVLVAAGDTVETAIDACRPAAPTLVVAHRFSQSGIRRAMRLGVRALLRAADLTPARLAEAMQAAHDGDGRMPQAVRVGLFAGAEPDPGSGLMPLTPRQTTVLALMADGHGNADIARSLACSEHTIKNVIYELMGRLQARNRAHAVARGVRTGLI